MYYSVQLNRSRLMNKIKKNGNIPCDVYVLFNRRVTELIGTNINFEFKILILNLEFNLREVLL